MPRQEKKNASIQRNCINFVVPSTNILAFLRQFIT